MKRFTSFLLSLLLVFVAMAQSENTTINVAPGDGSYKGDGWCSSWKSTSVDYPVAITVGVNNLYAATTSGGFQMARGSNADSDWTFSVAGYKVVSYSFKFKSAKENQNVTLSATNADGTTVSMTSSFSDEKTFSIDCSNAATATFRISGSNYSIIATDLTLTVRPVLVLTSLEEGGVYHFQNRGNAEKALYANSNTDVNVTSVDKESYAQQWYVLKEGDYYILRNLSNGRFLKGAGKNSSWALTDTYSNDGNKFTLYSTGCNSLKTKGTADFGYMHYGEWHNDIIGWSVDAGNSQWDITRIDYDVEELEALLERLPVSAELLAEYQTAVNAIFTDAACTMLNSTYASMDDATLAADANYKQLPTTLKRMVKKVRDSSWAENNADADKASAGLNWDGKYAKRFRVQQYEPYSYGEKTSSMLRFYNHTNMNNPTGIVANAGDVIYIMVEGEIKEGAKLYVESLVGNGTLGNVGGTELHSGLNVLNYDRDGNQLFIHYVIETYADGTKTEYKLSNYEPLKIHIEGGSINGFFDTVGDELNPADTDSDWDYFEVRANQAYFSVLGKYVMWHMPLHYDNGDATQDANDYDLAECLGTGATSVHAAMDVWETIEYAQRLTEGLLSEEEIATLAYAANVFEYTGRDDYFPSDYSEEYNNRSLAYSANSGFAHASGWYTHYNNTLLHDIIKNIVTGGDTWAAGHEIGHTYQGPINLPSTSETSNNALCNISNYFLSRTSSRLGSFQSLLSQFNNKTSFLGIDINSNNVWEKLMIYQKMWFYYHVLGNNKKFYPRLFEMLRQDPIARSAGEIMTGTETMLKFYKKCCMAAGEDLTDLFTAFGFFVPVDGSLSDDYGDFKTIMTQDEIDAAKAEVAKMAQDNGWKKNIAILFIDDRIGSVIGADGQTTLAPRGDGGGEQGVLGSINDYDSDPSNDVCPTITGTYAYSLSGTSIAMVGATGGVGFAIYDGDGNLVSFATTYTFPLSEEAQAALALGTAKVYAVNADNTMVEIPDNNPTQTQTMALTELLSVVEDLLNYEDATETKIGWYKTNALTALKEAYEKAKQIYETNNLAAYSGAYSLLYNEYDAVISSATSRVWFGDGRTYYIKNATASAYMAVDASNVITTSTLPTASSTAALWQVNAGNFDAFYSIKNQSDGTCVQYPDKNVGNNVQFTMGSEAAIFLFEEVSTGKFSIKDRGSKKFFYYNSSNNSVVTWGSVPDAALWEFVYLPADETMTERTELEELMAQTQELIEEVSDTKVQYTELQLQTIDSDGQFYIWCNKPDPTEGDIAYLVDGITGDSDKFFHSSWHNNYTDDGTHYLEVDLGASHEYTIFKFAYNNRNGGSNHPDGITVTASNTKDNKTGEAALYSVTSGLPQSQNAYWLSPVFKNEGSYRYLHFAITAENHFWHMDEFDLFTSPVVQTTMLEKYTDIDIALVTTPAKTLLADSLLLNSTTTSADDFRNAYAELKDMYDDLLAAKNNLISEKITLETAELEELIGKAQSLVQSCVTEITILPATETVIELQATDPTAANYLYCNALYNKNSTKTEEELKNSDDSPNTAKLLDGDKDTWVHTNYDGNVKPDDDMEHYLLVDLGSGNSVTYFNFAYATRNITNQSHPKVIQVEGSNDKVKFEPIAVISSGLPNTAKTDYKPKLALGNGVENPYRYIRFMVTETYNNASAGGYRFFYMSEFDFYEATMQDFSVTLNPANSGNATTAEVLNTHRAVISAQQVLENATTAEQIVAATELLQKEYDILYNAVNAVDKSALNDLIEATEALKNSLYQQTYTPGNAIALQADNKEEPNYLYCNAPEGNSPYDKTDNNGVKALLDEDKTNFLHTEWTGDQSADGLAHYLRVDLGEGGKLSDFVFSYKSSRDLPKTFIVEGCNTADGEYERIGRYVGENTINTLITSGLLGNGNEYRYLRFRVIATQSNKKDNSGHHYYFVLQDFDVYPANDIITSSELKEEYASDIYVYKTSELVTEVVAGIESATEVVENTRVSQDEVNTAVEALQAVYDKLAEALKYASSLVKITTDVNSPNLYVIYSQRGDTENNSVWTQTSAKCWQYNFANKNITINNYDSESLYHLWYFTYDDDYDCYGIVPVMTPAYPMGSNNIGKAANRVFSVSLDDADGYVTLWSLSKSAATAADGVYYNFKPFGYNTYLSNIYGGSNALGFYGSEDGGSRVYFKSVEVEGLAFKRLQKLKDAVSDIDITPATEDLVGEYTVASATDYSNAKKEVSDMLDAAQSADSEYNGQFTELYKSRENLEISLPKPGALYKIRSKYVQNHYFFVNDDRAARYSNSHVGQNQVDADAVWVFEGEENGSLKLKNLQTGCFLPSLQGTGEFNLAESTDAAGAITLHPFGTGTGAVQIQAGNYYLHANDGSGAEQKLIGWYSGGIDGGNPVFIEEISAADAEELISHSVTLAANTTGIETIKKYSTLCLGYPVTLPAESDVKAYIASGIDDNNVIELVPVANDGKTIPANTPVILKSDSGVSSVTATFTADAVSSVDETTNLLGGSNYTTYVSCLNEQGENVSNVYMLTRKNGLIAMRWMYENYKLENGAYTQVENTASDDGGYVKCPANKAYLKLDAATSNLSTEYYFGFFGGATDINEVNTEENLLDGTIFDLQGRKIEEVTVPGFYIVNGKKMYVDTDMLK